MGANWRGLFGVPSEAEVTFDTWAGALHPDDRERAVETLNAAWRQQREFSTEYRIVRPDGTERWIIDRGRAFHDEKGDVVEAFERLEAGRGARIPLEDRVWGP